MMDKADPVPDETKVDPVPTEDNEIFVASPIAILVDVCVKLRFDPAVSVLIVIGAEPSNDVPAPAFTTDTAAFDEDNVAETFGVTDKDNAPDAVKPLTCNDGPVPNPETSEYDPPADVSEDTPGPTICNSVGEGVNVILEPATKDFTLNVGPTSSTTNDNPDPKVLSKMVAADSVMSFGPSVIDNTPVAIRSLVCRFGPTPA